LLAAALVAALELVAISLIRERFLAVSLRASLLQVAPGGAMIVRAGAGLGSAYAPLRMATIRVVEAKKHCCKGKPRCKRWAVVANRLALADLAERLDERTYLMHAPKKPSRQRADELAIGPRRGRAPYRGKAAVPACER
jgi:hypothetical protein